MSNAPRKAVPPQAIPQYNPEFAPPAASHAQQDRGPWQQEECGSPAYPVPNLSRPLTGSSFASTSSNYSVSDLPVPQIPEHIHQSPNQSPSQVRRPPLGPPPSARRGPSSYYAQNSFVPAIIEETDSIYSQSTRAHPNSYASSNAIPIGIPERYLYEGRDQDPVDDSLVEDPLDDDSSSDHAEDVSAVPVRQASVGKRSRPTITTIKSSDSSRPDSQIRPLSISTIHPETPVESVSATQSRPGGSIHSAEKARPVRPADQITARTNSSGVLPNGVAKIEATSEAEKYLNQKLSQELSTAVREQFRARSPLPQVESDDEDALRGDSAFDMDEKLNHPVTKGSLAQRIGSRRPTRLDVDAVRDAEARGSLTSLPDLIRRATRLASNLDRGKTASRLGMDWFGDEHRKSQASNEKRRSGNSLTDILASFPPPGLATPPGSRGIGQWPSHLRHSPLPSESDPGDAGPRKRRCCGMPLWLFLLLLVLVLLVVAAAIVIPIVLIVIPSQKSSVVDALASCQKSLLCQNSGINIVGIDGSCGCLCVNGYTGTRCTEDSATGCATTDVDSASNATVGDAIPRLLTGAQSNFSVSLNGSAIISMFASNNLSCTSENALVTFNGLSARSVDLRIATTVEHLRSDDFVSTPTIQEREDTTTSASDASTTSNGIVFDNASSSTSASSLDSAIGAVANSTSNSTMLDFARTAVLFVMQDSGQFENAVTAQENLQDYFTSGTTSTGATIDATNITLATGYTANLEKHTITTADGTRVGS